MQKFRKTVLGILLGIFSVCIGASIFMHLFLYSTLPTSPNEEGGHTFKMVVNHGFVRYGSAGELRAFRVIEDVVFPFAAVPFLAAFFLGLKWGIFKVRGAGEA